MDEDTQSKAKSLFAQIKSSGRAARKTRLSSHPNSRATVSLNGETMSYNDLRIMLEDCDETLFEFVWKIFDLDGSGFVGVYANGGAAHPARMTTPAHRGLLSHAHALAILGGPQMPTSLSPGWRCCLCHRRHHSTTGSTRASPSSIPRRWANYHTMRSGR